jgi:hypothetical protein
MWIVTEGSRRRSHRLRDLRKTDRSGVSGGAAFLVLIVGLFAGAGVMYTVSPTRTTTDTTTATSLSVTTTTITTTPLVPQQITVTGTYSTNGPGTSPVAIHFISDSNQISYPGQTSGNQYTVVLPNPDTYTVRIDGSNFAGIGGGTCTAGMLPLYEQFSTTVVVNWSC